jgi:methylmalonyl-CoA/ethylmalonyl-CoA epimerase
VKLGPLHHVALAVPRIEDALPFFRDTLAMAADRILDIPDQHVRIVFLGDAKGRIELIQPIDDQSGVAKFVAEHPKPTLHHVCYVVDDLAATLEGLAGEGVELIDRAPRRGAEGMVAFIHPRASGGVLIELIDRASLRDSIP